MTQLTLALELLPEAVSLPPVPLTAELKRALVTQMAAALLAVSQAGGTRSDDHVSSSSHNHPPAPATHSDRVSAPVLGAPGAASHRKPTLAVGLSGSGPDAGFGAG